MSVNNAQPVNQLPRAEYHRLLADLQLVQLNPGEILYQSPETIQHVYFPERGLISLITILETGATIEVGRVGTKGMVGIAPILGSDSSINSAMVLIAGSAFKLPVATFKQEFNRGGELQRLLLLYVQALLTQVMQNAACYSQHKIEQRLARLLLSVHDCLQQNHFALTQELIATMLGVRRAGVTNAANYLQKSAIIHYRRGNITIIDREALEKTSCECYWAIKTEFSRLFDSNV